MGRERHTERRTFGLYSPPQLHWGTEMFLIATCVVEAQVPREPVPSRLSPANGLTPVAGPPSQRWPSDRQIASHSNNRPLRPSMTWCLPPRPQMAYQRSDSRLRCAARLSSSGATSRPRTWSLLWFEQILLQIETRTRSSNTVWPSPSRAVRTMPDRSQNWLSLPAASPPRMSFSTSSPLLESLRRALDSPI